VLTSRPAVARRPFSTSRTARVAAVLVAAAAVAAAVTGLAGASPAAERPAGRAPVEWVAVKTADTQPRKLTPGASWVTYLDLHQSVGGRAGRGIGDASAACAVVEVTRKGAITQCQRMLRTDGGSLALSALTDRFGAGPYTGDAAIVGGTGDFAGATGESRITLDGKLVRFTLHLDR
jgi:hypothetical protein